MARGRNENARSAQFFLASEMWSPFMATWYRLSEQLERRWAPIGGGRRFWKDSRFRERMGCFVIHVILNRSLGRVRGAPGLCQTPCAANFLKHPFQADGHLLRRYS